MECNVGATEKIIRFILGFVFLYLGLKFNALFYVIAIILFATAAIGFCPLNKILGLNTCKQKEKKEEVKETKQEEGPEETETQEAQQQTTEESE